MNVDKWVIPKRDDHVCILGMLDKKISSLEVVDSILDRNMVLARGENKTKQNKNVRFAPIDVNPEQVIVMYDQMEQDLVDLS